MDTVFRMLVHGFFALFFFLLITYPIKRKLQSAYYYSVRDFGAVGDGITDDTNAIQAAIEHAYVADKDLFFPDGVYLLKKALFYKENDRIATALMCHAGQRLYGNGAVIKIGNEQVTHILFTENPEHASGYGGCRDVEIEGLVFDGNDAVHNNVTSINISHAKNISIKNCSFVNGKNWHAIEVNSSRDVIIKDCVFSMNSNSEDIQLDAAVNKGNLGLSDGTVCSNIVITDNSFKTNQYPAIGHHTDATHNNIIICDNVFMGDGGERGYISFMSLPHHIRITNNSMYDSQVAITMNVSNTDNFSRDNIFVRVARPITDA